MSRTLKSKLLYLLTLGTLGAMGLGVWTVMGRAPWVLLLLAALFLVPGRVQGHYWRAFFRGRRLQGLERWQDAINEYQRFLEDVNRRPWIRRLLWLSWSMYTFDAEAMTRNNIAGCELGLGRLDRAEVEFRRAVELDEKSPLPHYNLAIVSEVRGDRDAAERFLATAKGLGYERTSIDQVIHAASEFLAKIEGSIPRREGA